MNSGYRKGQKILNVGAERIHWGREDMHYRCKTEIYLTGLGLQVNPSKM